MDFVAGKDFKICFTYCTINLQINLAVIIVACADIHFIYLKEASNIVDTNSIDCSFMQIINYNIHTARY